MRSFVLLVFALFLYFFTVFSVFQNFRHKKKKKKNHVLHEILNVSFHFLPKFCEFSVFCIAENWGLYLV